MSPFASVAAATLLALPAGYNALASTGPQMAGPSPVVTVAADPAPAPEPAPVSTAAAAAAPAPVSAAPVREAAPDPGLLAATGALAPGEFYWAARAQSDGPVLLAVSIPDQKLYAYRGGTLFAVSTVSTGKRGHDTPTGVFPILEKRREHYSSLYNRAPMPFMQRLTWDGVALHAGKLPGYPASHGCVRLPAAFAERLFAVTRRGGEVIVTDRPMLELSQRDARFGAARGMLVASRD